MTTQTATRYKAISLNTCLVEAKDEEMSGELISQESIKSAEEYYALFRAGKVFKGFVFENLRFGKEEGKQTVFKNCTFKNCHFFQGFKSFQRQEIECSHEAAKQNTPWQENHETLSKKVSNYLGDFQIWEESWEEYTLGEEVYFPEEGQGLYQSYCICRPHGHVDAYYWFEVDKNGRAWVAQAFA